MTLYSKFFNGSGFTKGTHFFECVRLLQPVPTRFLVDYGNRLRDVVTWRGPSGWVGQVNLSYYDKAYGFRGGWKQFRYYHNIEAGDHVVCTMIADSDFVIKIYDKHGCEKALPFLNPYSEVILPATEKSTENAFPSELPNRSGLIHGIGNSTPKLGEKRGISIREDHSPSGTQKKLCTQQPDLGDRGTGNGTFDKSIENQNLGLGELPEKSRPGMEVDSSDGDSPVEMEEGGKPISENISTLFSEKSPEMEDSDIATKEMEIRQAIYEAQVTNPLSTALRAARAYTTVNPSTICVVNKTAASKSQSVSLCFHIVDQPSFFSSKVEIFINWSLDYGGRFVFWFFSLSDYSMNP